MRRSRSRVDICGIETENASSPLSIQIEGIDDPEYLTQLNIELQTLILTRMGTLPGSRDYGLRANFLDYVTPGSINQFAVELSTAIDKWIPEVMLREVRAETDELGSAVGLILTMELRDEV